MKALLKTFAAALARRLGGTLVSTNHYTLLATQRLNLLADAAALYRPTLTGTGAVGIVFSFNRPVQLHALLASYFLHAANPAPLIVQYGASSPQAEEAYKQVADCFTGHPVTFVRETTCRDTLIAILNGLTQPKLFFLVDDDLFIRPVDMAAFTAIDPLANVPSLRLGPHLNYSYTMRQNQPPPNLAESPAHPGMLTWQWGDAGNEWNYPFSVEGHLFDTAEIVMMTRNSPFKAPNTYEGMLAGFGALAASRPGLCYPHSVLFGIPCNKVQDENANHAGESHAVTPEEFLARWQAGEQIDPAALNTFTPTSPHQEVPFTFIPRPAGK